MPTSVYRRIFPLLSVLTRADLRRSGAKYELIYRGEGINVCSSSESWRIKDAMAGEKLISARQTIGIHLFTEMIDDTRQCLPGVLGCVTKAYLSRSGPNRERHRGGPLYFYFVPTRSFHRSFRDQSRVTKIVSESHLSATSCPTLGEAGPSPVIDHRVTAPPLPNFKYASQSVTMN